MREDQDTGKRSPFVFFALVFALSLPFWALGAFLNIDLMPGLPISSLMIIAPALAAIILSWHDGGSKKMLALLARAGDIRRLRGPFVIAGLILINPGLYIAAYLIQRASGIDVPPPHIDIVSILVLFLLFLAAATAEELGWTGYVLAPLQSRWGMIRAALVIGVVWAIWHLIPLGHADRSLSWVFWWALGTIAARVLMIWLYNHSGHSVFGLSLYHAISNTCWQTYPIEGSFYDPRIFAALTIALVIILLWARPDSAERSKTDR